MWGTVVGVDLRDDLDALDMARVLDAVFAWFRRVDDLFSTWRDDSEISRLARGEMTLEQTSDELRRVLDLCEQVRVTSDGVFDITFATDRRVAPRPGFGPIDPSGLVKGWALEQAATILRAEGADNFTINAGGDVVAVGGPSAEADWRVGIQHPWDRDAMAAVVAVRDRAVATSGRYERGEHIIDPRTGRPPAGLASVTVIGDDLALADGYATAALVLGASGMDWLAGIAGVEALGITDSRTVVLTDGFDRYRVS